MEYTTHYASPIGEILLAGDEVGITGLWFVGARYCPAFPAGQRPGDCPAFPAARRWLDRYFAGGDPGDPPPLHPAGSPFRLAVWALLRDIPYGQTVTYGALAARIAAQRGLPRMSAQAVGGAVGRNPISLLIPCHRVVGADGSLTGYAGGTDKKAWLLRLERARPPAGTDRLRLL